MAEIASDGRLADDVDSNDEEEVVMASPLVNATTAAQPESVDSPAKEERAPAADEGPQKESTLQDDRAQVSTSSAEERPAQRRFAPSWWDRDFMIQYGHEVNVLIVRLKEKGIGDSDALSLAFALESYVARMVDPSLPITIDFDVSVNSLGDSGVRLLVQSLRQLIARHEPGVQVRILKLYKNRASDDACEAIASLLSEQQAPVEEIHLSHNDIGRTGFVAILAALAMHPGGIYPRQTRSGPCPCWVRVEHNQVHDVEKLLAALSGDPVQLRICFAPRSYQGASCTSYSCIQTADWDSVAHAHLFCAKEQRMPAEQGKERAEALVRRIVQETLDRTCEAAAASSPPEALLPTALLSRVASPRGAIEIREAVLKVDAEKGAGLELEESPFGYYVLAVEAEPGQDLHEGDVILEIDGVALWGELDEDSLSSAFGSRFSSGAHLRVGRAEDLTDRPLWQALGMPEGSLTQRCLPMRDSLMADLQSMCRHTGLQEVKLEEHLAAVIMAGRPSAQRRAVEELPGLLSFYFPEVYCTGSALPRCCWYGEASVKCVIPDAHPLVVVAPNDARAAGASKESGSPSQPEALTAWAEALQKQVGEDEEASDEDLPCEPLEAPDDGPNVYEGEMLLAPVWELSRPIRVLILVGFPGSGKSTLAANLQLAGWVVVNQDTLGDRKACVAAGRAALQGKQKVVIDRCNISRMQRRVWLGLADEFEVGAACLWLDVPPQECGLRVLQRFGHQTLPAHESSLGVIDSFAEKLERPVEAEGFVLWRVHNDEEIQVAVEDMEEVVQRSEDDYEEEAATQAGARIPTQSFQPLFATGPSYSEGGGKGRSVYLAQGAGRTISAGSGPSAARKAARSAATSQLNSQVWQASNTAGSSSGNFRYTTSSQRRERALFLRSVRRQVEYYFSDKNLHQDWFLHEKITSDPEKGWLELRWLLQCPRIRDTFRANAQDVLDCLAASNLMVKEALGTHWVRRGKPPPPLDVQRPTPGEEPDWYKKAHGEDPTQMLTQPSKDGAGIICTACGRTLAEESFSKAQLTKHRKKPTCKACLAAAPS